VLENGRVVIDGAASDLFENPEVESRYLGVVVR